MSFFDGFWPSFHPTLANRETSLKIIWVSATRPDRIPTSGVLQRGERCAVAVRGFRVPRGRSATHVVRRCEMRPFLSPVSPASTVTPPMRPLFPLRDTSTLCREQSRGEGEGGREREREREREFSAPGREFHELLFPADAHSSREYQLSVTKFLAFRTNLLAQNFSDSGVRGTPGQVFAPLVAPPPHPVKIATPATCWRKLPLITDETDSVSHRSPSWWTRTTQVDRCDLSSVDIKMWYFFFKWKFVAREFVVVNW